jgi:hypothetical protein
VVTKLDRLARSLPDARAIADEPTSRQVKLNLGGSVHDPTDPVGRLLFNVLAMVAEFEADLIRARTREGMKVAKAKGRLRGKQPKLSPMQEKHLVELVGDDVELAFAPHDQRAIEVYGAERGCAPRTRTTRSAPASRNRSSPSAAGSQTSCAVVNATPGGRQRAGWHPPRASSRRRRTSPGFPPAQGHQVNEARVARRRCAPPRAPIC